MLAVRRLNPRNFHNELSEHMGAGAMFAVLQPNVVLKPDDSTQVSSCPRCITERYFLDIHGPHGYCDPFTMVSVQHVSRNVYNS